MKAQEWPLGLMIDRAKSVAQIFRLVRDDRDARVNRPRVSAMFETEVDVHPHQAHAVLEHHVCKRLAELAEVRPKPR
jgi:hypothetical protein